MNPVFPDRTALVRIFDGPDRPLRLETLPLPSAIEEGEVLVEILLATVCGSDLHTLAGHRAEGTPCILGHEAVGRVVRSGRPGLSPGDRVTWSIADSCGRCVYCTEYGMPEKCASVFKYGHAPLDDGAGLNGCYASHILLRGGTHIIRVDPALPDSIVAPVNCALATVMNAVSHLPHDCRAVVIQGAGLLGLYACAVLNTSGVEQVFCIDIDAHRLALVSRFGGIAIDGNPDGYAQERGRIEAAAPGGVDAVVEVAGVSGLIPEGIRLLRTGGTYVFAGMVHPQSQLDITGEQIIRKCLTIRGVHNYSPLHLDRAVTFLSETARAYPYEALVGPPYPLEDLPRAIEAAQEKRYCRVSVKPG